MITRSSPQVQVLARDSHPSERGDWRRQLARAISDPVELCTRLELPAESIAPARQGHSLFRVRVPEAYLERIKPGDPNDPLLLQVLPRQPEQQDVSGYVSDPLEEAEHRPLPGLIHKYSNRVLVIMSGACAVNCRYCFRRHFPYADNTPSRQRLDDILAYLGAHPEINEVILSGGDPLAANDQRLAWFVGQLDEIPQLTRLRLHTRLPVVIPDRIDDALLGWLANTRLKTVVVVHINHPNEIDGQVEAACQRLRQAGATLLNQSVILKGINDDVDTLAALSERLFDAGILPYYLHAFDPVAGAAHFDVTDADAIALVEALRNRISGFLTPRLVREIPGEASKTPLR